MGSHPKIDFVIEKHLTSEYDYPHKAVQDMVFSLKKKW